MSESKYYGDTSSDASASPVFHVAQPKTIPKPHFHPYILQEARAIELQKAEHGHVDLTLKTSVPSDLLKNQPNITTKSLNSMMSETSSDGYAPAQIPLQIICSLKLLVEVIHLLEENVLQIGPVVVLLQAMLLVLSAMAEVMVVIIIGTGEEAEVEVTDGCKVNDLNIISTVQFSVC